MPQDFRHQDLQGRSFRGQDLTDSDFSGANICGADFSNTGLVGANFQQVKAGQQRPWVLGIVLGLVSIAFLGGYIVGWLAGAISSVMLRTQNQPLAIGSGIGACLVLLVVATILVRRGLGAALGAVVVSIPTVIVLAVALSQSPAQRLALAFILLQLLNAAAAIAAVIAGAIAMAIGRTIAGRLPFILALSGFIISAIAGIWEGIENRETYHTTQAIPVAVLISIGLISLSMYISSQAIRGNHRYALIRRLALIMAATGGTRFRFANLTDADFTQSILNNSDFRNAVLKRTCWFQARQLEQARTEGTYLADPQIAQLVITQEGHNQIFDHKDLRGLDLKNANLQDASFVGADLSEATLENADLSRSKLVQTQLARTNLSRACLTGAYIQNWGISTDTNLAQIRCAYIYIQLPSPEDPDPCRKPDNRQETFQEGEFEEFISPIIKTLDLYRQQGVDLRKVGKAYKTLDLFHHEGIDPSAAAIALKQLAEQYPEAGLEVVAMEGRGDEKIRLQARVTGQADRSQLSAEYFTKYQEAAALPYGDMQSLLTAMAEKDQRIRSLENMVMTSMQSDKFYVETYYDLGKRDEETPPVHKILILTANPQNTSKLRLDAEVREIQTGLERAKKRDQFEIITKWAVRPEDLRRALLDYEPQIVHFSGHGVAAEGLALENETGQTQLVSTSALASLFEVFKDKVECVLLNACYSAEQAEAIRQHIPYVIGMNHEIGDRAALEFAVGFYDALGAGRSIDDAFKLGCVSIELEGIPESLTPVLKHKDTFAPNQV